MAEPETFLTEEASPRRSIIDTWLEVFADLSGLVQVEARLAREETAENIRGAGRSIMLLAAGGLLVLVALVFVAVAGLVALAAVIGMMWALLAVAAISVLIGILLIAAAQRRLERQSFLPERALSRMAGDLQSMADRVDAPTTTYGDEDDQSPEKQR